MHAVGWKAPPRRAGKEPRRVPPLRRGAKGRTSMPFAVACAFFAGPQRDFARPVPVHKGHVPLSQGPVAFSGACDPLTLTCQSFRPEQTTFSRCASSPFLPGGGIYIMILSAFPTPFSACSCARPTTGNSPCARTNRTIPRGFQINPRGLGLAAWSSGSSQDQSMRGRRRPAHDPPARDWRTASRSTARPPTVRPIRLQPGQTTTASPGAPKQSRVAAVRPYAAKRRCQRLRRNDQRGRTSRLRALHRPLLDGLPTSSLSLLRERPVTH
jgi:hypothetical protein